MERDYGVKYNDLSRFRVRPVNTSNNIDSDNIDRQLLKSLLMLGSVVEARDPYTGGHLWRVAQFAKLLGAQLELTTDEMFGLTVGAFLHDIGKIGIPDSVLLKHEPLTDDEFEVIKTHPVIGASLLREHPLGHLAIDVVTHHHEWVDGRGYPEMESHEELTAPSQIVGLVDAFDALTSTRPYRSAKTIDKALAIIDEQKGAQFEPRLVNTFESLVRTGRLSHIVQHSYEGRPLIDCPDCGPIIATRADTSEGDELPCPACGGLFKLHRVGERFEAEFTGTHAPPSALTPKPDTEAIDYHLAAFG